MGSLGTNGDFTKPVEVKITLATKLGPVARPGTTEYMAYPHTDHMITVRWTSANGWETPELKPAGPLQLSPGASCLHYATECFEGMKAYRGMDGKLRLFRPDCNGERLAMSAARASLPTYPASQLKHLIAALVKHDGERYLPKDNPGSYFYLRPAIIGTGRKLGYKIPDEALLFIIATPYKDLSTHADGTPVGLKLRTSAPNSVRSWPGGFGYAKLGANYCPSLEAHSKAVAEGFAQILWLLGENRLITEAGASNLFIVWKNKETGRVELVTPSLKSQLILSGITRRSVLELARERLTKPVQGLEALDVVERDVSIWEIEKAGQQGRLIEAFVAGTAYFITSVASIDNGDVSTTVPMAKNGYTALIKAWLEAITYGTEKHDWGLEVEG